MRLTEPDLNQVLKLVDRLEPDQLAVVRERLQARAGASRIPARNFVDEAGLSFDDYLSLPDQEREKVQLRAYELNRRWIDLELNRRKAEWVLVCDGQVLESSGSLHDYPSREKLMETGRQRGRVPFVFVRAPLIEETEV